MTTTSRGKKLIHIISLTHSYGKENRREHWWFTRLDFCWSCLQLMTSGNTAVYRYHSIFETVYYRRAFPNTVHPYNIPTAWSGVRTLWHQDTFAPRQFGTKKLVPKSPCTCLSTLIWSDLIWMYHFYKRIQAV